MVHKDSEAYHQWATYWLILHFYITIVSPFLHLTLHPLFQLLAILWLSLPRYQGASVVYDHLVVPWVDKYEEQVDDAVEEAHRGVRRWVFRRMGRVIWVMMGEGGSLLGGLLDGVSGIILGGTLGNEGGAEEDINIQPSTSMESLPPRHSVKEALSQSSSYEELVNGENYTRNKQVSNEANDNFVQDFMVMLQQGLYVFANVDMTDASNDGIGKNGDRKREKIRHGVFDGGFKLGVFSYSGQGSFGENENGAFVVSPSVGGDQFEEKEEESCAVSLPIRSLKSLAASGSQGLILDCQNVKAKINGDLEIRIQVEIVLSDESDRDILLSGLNRCLPWLSCEKHANN